MKSMSNALAIALTIAGLSACNSNKTTQVEERPMLHKEDLSDLVGAYEFVGNGDTISLDLKAQNDSLVGKLTYALAEKDKNVGVFRGVIQDSIIVGDYYFMSEGIESKRETVLGILPNGLIEGFGEVTEDAEGMKFLDKSQLRFDHGMLLEKKK